MSMRPAQENLYIQRINTVIDHVREHLNDDLPLETLSRVAGFSPFHFHRLFKSITTEKYFWNESYLLEKEQNKELGAFSISLAVKDIQASKDFYEKLGFKPFGGDISQNWLILKNGDHVIGLFQGMFEKNLLTFNPGWNQEAQNLDTFTDVRELQRQLKAQGVEFASEADESTTGPAYFMILDPDGNPILVDQHVWSGETKNSIQPLRHGDTEKKGKAPWLYDPR